MRRKTAVMMSGMMCMFCMRMAARAENGLLSVPVPD